MKWRLTNNSKEKQLQRSFRNRGIDSSQPAFYDFPAFRKSEDLDPRILNDYAEYVEVREYAPDYLLSARKNIEAVVHAVGTAIRADGRMGACVDASMMIGRMLDRLGVWNYVAKATLSIEFSTESRIQPIYFPDLDPTRSFAAAHAIVVAPPFGIIDVTLRQQPYPGRIREYLPDYVIANDFSDSQWEIADVMSDEAVEAAISSRMHPEIYYRKMCPEKIKMFERLKPRSIVCDGTALKYVIVGVGGFLERLEDFVAYKPSGRSAFEIFEEDVKPTLIKRTTILESRPSGNR